MTPTLPIPRQLLYIEWYNNKVIGHKVHHHWTEIAKS